MEGKVCVTCFALGFIWLAMQSGSCWKAWSSCPVCPRRLHQRPDCSFFPALSVPHGLPGLQPCRAVPSVLVRPPTAEPEPSEAAPVLSIAPSCSWRAPVPLATPGRAAACPYCLLPLEPSGWRCFCLLGSLTRFSGRRLCLPWLWVRPGQELSPGASRCRQRLQVELPRLVAGSSPARQLPGSTGLLQMGPVPLSRWPWACDGVKESTGM